MCNCEEGMTKKAFEYEKIQLAENQVKTCKKAWLTKYGWKESCDFIDAGWRWCKKIDGKMYMCDMQEAINIEYNYIDP